MSQMKQLWLALGICAVVGVLGVGGLVVLGSMSHPIARSEQSSNVQPVTAETGNNVPSFDQAQLDKYLADNFSTTTWWPLVKRVEWDGNVLTAHTKLYPDADAKLPATAVCAALSGYWVTSGKPFQSVRVLDQADNVLVSRHTIGDTCTWRR